MSQALVGMPRRITGLIGTIVGTGRMIDEGKEHDTSHIAAVQPADSVNYHSLEQDGQTGRRRHDIKRDFMSV
ncbi:MAG: hypothetical protein AAF636_10660 [Pseudomonadota bacterium]